MYFSLLERRFKILSLLLSLLVSIIGFIVVSGWATVFTSYDIFGRPWSAVKLNTGICFLAAGIALIISNYSTHLSVSGFRQWIVDLLAGFVFIIGLLTLLEYLLGTDIGLGEILVTDKYAKPGSVYPGRMAFMTAISFVLTGTSLYFQNKGPKSSVAAHFSCISFGIIGLVNLSGYLFSVEDFYTYNGYTPMALPEAIAFLLMMFAIFFSKPRMGLMQFVTEKSQGSLFFRVFFPVTLLMMLAAAIISHNVNTSRIQDEYADSIIYPVFLIFFAFIFWCTAYLLYKYDKKLRRSELDYTTIVENSIDTIFIMRGRQYVYVNPAFCRMSGYTIEEVTSTSFNYLNLHPENLQDQVEQYMKAALAGEIKERKFQTKILTKSRKEIRADVSCSIQKDEKDSVRIFGIVHDITEQWLAQEREKKLLRFNQFIGKINEIIVRVNDEATLFKEICDITVQVGKFKMCWIGKVDNQDNKVVPVAWAGDENGYFTAINQITVKDEPEGRGPIGRSIRNGHFYYCNDIANDIIMLPWRKEALERGYHSSVSFPLKIAGKAIGSFTMFAAEAFYFNIEELDLVQKVSDNISIGLEAIYVRKEKLKAEDKLRKNERLFRMLTENASDLIYRRDFLPSPHFSYVSPSVFLFTGYSPAEIYADPHLGLKVVHPDDLSILEDLNEGKYGDNQPFVLKWITKRGKMIWTEHKVRRVTDESGYVVAVEGIARDITERTLIGKKLEESEKLFRLLTENANDIIFRKVFDPAQRFEYISPSVEKITGYTVEEFYKDPTLSEKIIHPDDMPIILQQASGEIPFLPEMTLRFIGKDGNVIWIEEKINYFYDETGKVIAAEGIARDITSRKNSELQIEKSEKKYRELLSDLSVGIIQYGPGKEIITVNKTALELLGLTEDQIFGKISFDSDWNVIHEDGTDFPVTEQPVSLVLATKTPHKNIVMGVLRPSTKERTWLSVNAVPEFDADHKLKTIIVTFIDISKRKEAEQVVHESFERLSKIASRIPGMIYQYKLYPDGRSCFPYASNAIKYIYQVDPSEVVSDASKVFELFHPEDFDYIIQSLKESAEKLKPWRYDYRVKYNDGTIRYLSGSALPQKEEDGSVIWYGFIHDITEKKQVEEKVLQLSRAVEQSPASIVITDTKGNIQYVNSKFSKITGYSIEEAVGKNPRILKSGKTSAHEYKILWETIARGKEWRGEFENIKKNGEIFWEMASISPIFNGKGEIINFLAVKEDITERKVIEKELQESEEKYRSIFRISPFPMWVIREGDLQYMDVNEAAIKDYGYTREELLNMKAYDLRPKNEFKAIIKTTNIFHNGYQGVWKHLKKNGEIINVEIYIQKMMHLGIPCFVSMAIDITKRQKAEEELKEAYQELRSLAKHLQNIREEERSTIARDIHDDLGQQLTVLKMGISFAMDKTREEDKELRDDLNELKTMVGSTINSVRKLSNNLKPRVLDDLGLIEAFQWQCQEFEKYSGYTVKSNCSQTKIELAPEKRLALFRIFQESLTNIMRYAQGNEVVVNLTIQNKKLELRIEDNGKGFNTAILKKTKSLGIIGMKERALMLEGTLSVESEPGKGTRVNLTVPL